MTRTYTGTIVRASHDTQTPTVTIRIPVTDRDPPRPLAEVTMHCGTRIAVEAACLIGRKVEFQAELSERTHCLTDIKLCVRSEFGLKAVREDTRVSGVREAAPPLSDDGGLGGRSNSTVTTLMPRPSWRRSGQ